MPLTQLSSLDTIKEQSLSATPTVKKMKLSSPFMNVEIYESLFAEIRTKMQYLNENQ